MSREPFDSAGYAAYLVSERAYLLHTEGHHREALTLFEGLLEIYPENLYYRDSVAALYLALGTPLEAIHHASLVIASNPSHIKAILRRSEAHLLMGNVPEASLDVRRLRELGAERQAQRVEMRLRAVQQASHNGVTAELWHQ